MYKGLILMNDNALVALMFLENTGNPYNVFCKYISFCLEFGTVVPFEVLSKNMNDKCGLKLPLSLYVKCFKVLETEGTIEIVKNKKTIIGYKLIDGGFDGNEFKTKFEEAKIAENNFLNDMVNYINKEYKREWTISDARKNLIYYLNYNSHMPTSIFLYDNIFEIELNDEHEIDNLGLVQKYLSYIYEKGGIYSICFREIINGLMILNGSVYSDLSEKEEKHLKGVKFYFDTKLILRYLGFTTNVYKDATHELVNLITNSYGGKVCIFQKTLSEVANVIRKTKKAIAQRNIRDLEMELYYNEAKEKNGGIFGVDNILENCSDEELLRKALTENGCFEVEPNIEWKDKSNWKYNIDGEELKEFIHDCNPDWKEAAISVDVDIFIQLNMLRRGDYSKRYGGYKKLPVLVTTNTELIRCVRDYIRYLSEQDIGVEQFWKSKNLPYITDNALTCELWLPKFTENCQTTQIVQALVAHAVTPIDYEVYNTIKDTVGKIKKSKNVNIICDINVERERYYTEYLLKHGEHICNDLENSEIILSAAEGKTIDLIQEIKTLKVSLKENKKQSAEKESVIENMKFKLSEKDKQIDASDKILIETVSESLVKKVGFVKYVFIFKKYWWLIGTVLIFLLMIPINTIVESLTKIDKGWGIYIVSVLPATVKLVEKIANKFISQKLVSNWIGKKCDIVAERMYKNRIIKKIPQTAKMYEKRIIAYCFENSKYFQK